MTAPSDQRPDDERELEELTDAQLGEPVAELEDLAWQAGDDFGRKVTGRIERRLLTGSFLDMAWTGPLMVILELLRVPFEMFSGNRRTK